MKKTNRTTGTKAIIIALVCAVVLLSVFSGYEIHSQRLLKKCLFRLGIVSEVRDDSINYSVDGWANCLKQSSYDCDVVFFGDSLTRGCNFGEYFDDKEVCNLGLAGDTLNGMKKRVGMIKAVSPEKVFILGGINGLRDHNVDVCIQRYTELLDLIEEAVPDAEIYIQSVLPIASYKESTWYGGGICKNSTIRAFNEKLKGLAEERGIIYIDLYSLYEKDGSLNPDYTKDGVHLNGNYEPWAEAVRKYID